MLDVKKLTPYFRALSGKSRLIVYLLGTGDFSFDRVRKLTVKELNTLSRDIPHELELIDICSELVRDLDASEFVFTSASRPFHSINDLISILKRAHKNAEVDYVGLDYFVKKVALTKSKKRKLEMT